MMRRLALCLVGLLPPCLSGCGTALNFCSFEDKTFPHEAHREVYGGVKYDATGVPECLKNALEADPHETAWVKFRDAATDVCVAALLVIDLPLSAIADTLTLPITLQSRQEPARAAERSGPFSPSPPWTE
jgi:uncharacterized protein YceK